METTEETAQETVKSTGKRQRASREEMNARKDQVVSFIASRPNAAPSTIGEVMSATGLSQIKASTLIRDLTEEGRVQVIGKDGRKLLLRPGNGVRQEKEAAKAVARQMPQQLPAADINSILTQIHVGLGGALRVAGFHIVEGEQPTIDLKTEDGETLRVAVVSDGA